MSKKLLAEAADQEHYGARMKKLSDKLPRKLFIINVGETVPIPDPFLTQVADLFERNKTFRGSILVVLLEALVCKYIVGRKNPIIEERAKNLYRCLDTIIPVAFDAVAVNLVGAPSNSGCRYALLMNVLLLHIFKTEKCQTLFLAWKVLSSSGKLTANIGSQFHWKLTQPRWLRG